MRVCATRYGGCGCRVGGSAGQRGALGAVLALLAGVVLGARRRRKAS
ncbi:MYXO-CTERM sorting domain-containing protein [Myxococcota bacterium]